MDVVTTSENPGPPTKPDTTAGASANPSRPVGGGDGQGPAAGLTPLLPTQPDATSPKLDEQAIPLHDKVRRVLFGAPRDLRDRRIFHTLALVPFLAWVGLGADGLSSAAYGPAEAFLALGEHRYLVVVLAVLTAATVLIIAAAYSRIIEAFPQGGGGYVVATKLLGPSAGGISGCALLVDYVLTITVSIAAAGDAIFSLLPPNWLPWKVPTEIGLIVIGITFNIRGVKESVLPLVPVFMLFLVTHALLIGGGIFFNAPALGDTAADVTQGFQNGYATLGLWGMTLLVIRAYSLGAGTYTGIEAVSNGLNIMREPRVQTGKTTMRYMSISLAITAAGLIVCFLLMGEVTADERQLVRDGVKTLNAMLAERLSGNWGMTGEVFLWLTLASEAAILVVAAQTGFIGGPRVLANMALDGWVPRHFASLSDRLTQQNGIVLMGAASLAALLFTGGHVHTLVIMYSINVFITFSLSMAGMVRASFSRRGSHEAQIAAQKPILFLVGLVMCVTILAVTVYEKFGQGGWVTLIVTGGFLVLCMLIRGHYRHVSARVIQLQRDLSLPDKAHAPKPPPFDKSRPTAAVLVGGYSGLGMHTMLQALSSFGGYFKNVVFVSVGVIDTGAFKGEAELEALKIKTQEDLERYVEMANRLGVPAQARYAIGLDLVDELEKICLEVQKEFGRVSFFAGQLTFQQERWFDRLLHNQTAFSLQRRLHWAGIPMLILPIRVR